MGGGNLGFIFRSSIFGPRCFSQPAAAANQIFGIGFDQHLSADGSVGSGHTFFKIAKGHAFGSKPNRINVHLILDGVAADAGDFGYSRDGVELGANIPILNSPEPVAFARGAALEFGPSWYLGPGLIRGGS